MTIRVLDNSSIIARWTSRRIISTSSKSSQKYSRACRQL